MAGIAPGKGGDRCNSGTQSDRGRDRFLGDVWLAQGHFVVAWHETIEGLWIGFPIGAQYGPLHRSHVPLTPDEVAPFISEANRSSRMLIRTGQPELIPADAQFVGWLDIEVTKRIGRALRRSSEARISERGGFAL